MTGDRIFLDTVFIQALLNGRDASNTRKRRSSATSLQSFGFYICTLLPNVSIWQRIADLTSANASS
jgi:hypothetical protein